MIDTCAFGFEDLNNDEMQVSGGECPSVLYTYEGESNSSLEAENTQDELQRAIFKPMLLWGASRFLRRPRFFMGVWF